MADRKRPGAGEVLHTDRHLAPPVPFGYMDQYDHLYNVMAGHFFETYWLTYLATRQLSIPDCIRDFGVKYMYRRGGILEYKGQVREDDIVQIHTTANVNGPYLTFNELMLKEEKVVLKYTNSLCFVNVSDGKPLTRVPEGIVERLRIRVQVEGQDVGLAPEVETGRIVRFSFHKRLQSPSGIATRFS